MLKPVRIKGKDGAVQEGGYVHAMYLDDNSPIAGGREIWGFRKKLAKPLVAHESETLVFRAGAHQNHSRGSESVT